MDQLSDRILRRLFSFLQYEILLDYGRIGRVCKRWFRIVCNINQLVLIWPPTRDFEGFYLTSQFLSRTRFIPTEETANLLVFDYLCQKSESPYAYYSSKTITIVEDRLVEMFTEHFTVPRWQNLPRPTWHQVKQNLDKIYIPYERDYYGYSRPDPKKTRGEQWSVLLRSSLRAGDHAFTYLWNMMETYEKDASFYIHFSGDILECMSHRFRDHHITTQFIDWFVTRFTRSVTPHGLYTLVEAGVPFENIQKYAELPIKYDWNGWDCTDDTIYDDVPTRVYSTLWNAYSYQVFIRAHDSPLAVDPQKFVTFPENHDLMKGLTYFYRRAPAKAAKDAFCVAQNGTRWWIRQDLQDSNCSITRKTLEYLAWVDQFLTQNADVHPLHTIEVYNWYRTTKPYIKIDHRTGECEPIEVTVEKQEAVEKARQARKAEKKDRRRTLQRAQEDAEGEWITVCRRR